MRRLGLFLRLAIEKAAGVLGPAEWTLAFLRERRRLKRYLREGDEP